MKYLSKIVGLSCCLLAASASASCLTSERLTGVNIAGAEFGKLPGRLNFDYIYPTRSELEKLAEFGGNTVRLPVRWERVRPTANGALNATELTHIAATVAIAKELGLCVILDLHNYGKYHGKALKDNTELKNAFTDTWVKLAKALPDTGHVALGLMNEPVNLPIGEWAKLAQATVLQLRQQKSRHLILVPGGSWSGAHSWFSGSGDNINAKAFEKFTDPLNNYALEVHQYADSDYSGTRETCKDAAQFERIFTRISEWATTHDKRLFLGEFGVARNSRCLDTLGEFMKLTRDGPWLGWAYWAAGRWWGSYPMAVSLKSMSDSPQWAELQPFLTANVAATPTPLPVVVVPVPTPAPVVVVPVPTPAPVVVAPAPAPVTPPPVVAVPAPAPVIPAPVVVAPTPTPVVPAPVPVPAPVVPAPVVVAPVPAPAPAPVSGSGAVCLTAERLTGVNIAGAEFGKLPGRLNFDYIYPTRSELEKLAEFGGNTVRLPVRWERVRPTANGALNATELTHIAATVAIAKELGLCVILDLHNYGKYHGKALKDNTELKNAFTDTWVKLAKALPDTGHVALGLINEPVNLPIGEWAKLAQATVLQLRQQKSRHLILVPGGSWSGAHSWFSGSGDNINAKAFEKFTDPLNNYALEVHQYADSDYSGTRETCKDAAQFERIFTRISEWATTHDKRLFLGEFGVARNSRCLDTLGEFMKLTRDGPWLGWAYWAAGRWWGSYPMAVSLKSMSDSPQWAKLQPYLAANSGTAAMSLMLPDAEVSALADASPASTGDDPLIDVMPGSSAGVDLTAELRTLSWGDGDGRDLVDLDDDLPLPEQGPEQLTLISAIQLLDQDGPMDADVTQQSNGELLISSDVYASTLLPVRVTVAEPDAQEGAYVNADGDVVFVTSDRRVVLSYPALQDKAGFAATMDALGLQFGYDERANIVGRPGGAETYYFSARPDVAVLPASDPETGIRYDSVAGLPNATLVSLVFEDAQGLLYSQAVVPVPADWLQLKAGLAALPGVSEVQIDAQGIISVLLDGQRMQARSGFRVDRGATGLANPERVVFQPVADSNGDGRADFNVIYPNGDKQLLLIYPQSE